MAPPSLPLRRLQADMEAHDPLLAYGQPQLPRRQLSPIKRDKGDALESKHQVFITQGAGGAQEEGTLEGEASRRASVGGVRASQDGGRYGAHRVSHGGGSGFRSQPRGDSGDGECITCAAYGMHWCTLHRLRLGWLLPGALQGQCKWALAVACSSRTCC